MATLADLLSQLDPNPAQRGKQFERICQWFLLQDPVYAHELRRVWLWHEWPEKWGADAGIDLVAEDRHGQLWAIQAKAYSPSTAVTKRDIDTFLSESGRPEFSFRLLIATTNQVGRTAQRTIEGQDKPASVLLLGDLEAADLDWPTSPTMLTPRNTPPKRVQPHQCEAIDNVLNGFRNTDRGQLRMACGTGKTLTSLLINAELRAKRTLVLLPSLSLLAQTLREWTANAPFDFEFLPVCSDKTVAEPDAALATTSDLGFPVTTSPDRIAAFLRTGPGSRVVFGTYQSSPEIAKAFQLGSVPPFDLIIADEAHRCAGRISSDFATVLDNDTIPAHRRLFMTATPRYFTGKAQKHARNADLEIASMDDATMFGPVFHRLGFAQAIKRELLTGYRVIVIGVNDTTCREWAQSGRIVTIGDAEITDARSLAGQIGIAKAMHRYDLRRTITFHSRVRRAQQFARSLPDVVAWMPKDQRPTGAIWARHVSGEMPTGRRYALMKHLGTPDCGERALLANARCLAEGVDIPALDSVAFVDPRQAEIEIVQAVGRAIRRAGDKTIGTIIIPIFVDPDQDATVALDSSAFKVVWDVIRALRAHDDELAERLDTLRQEMGHTGTSPCLPNKIIIDLPVQVDSDFARAFDVRLVEQATAAWEFWFGLLRQYIDQHGHARVPPSSAINDYKLGQWVAAQRWARGKGTLDHECEDRLDALPGWTWDPFADQWEEGFRSALTYVERNGHARIPQRCIVDGFQLGWWASWQRANHARGTLPSPRRQRLQELPGWSWQLKADQWEKGFDKLLEYAKYHAHARVPALYATVDGFPLGHWVEVQRRAYSKETIKAHRRDRLETVLGWTWDPRVDKWETAFNYLLEFVKMYKHARVPNSYRFGEYQLGAWVERQRKLNRDGKLDLARKEQLETLHGWTWDPFTDKWEETFCELLQFVELNGHARVAFAATGLGRWVALQREKYAKGALDRNYQRRLSAITGWTWDPTADKWDEGFRYLRDYIKKNGSARVPYSYVTDDGYGLGRWVTKQRRRYASGKLEVDRQYRLLKLPDWAWKVRGA